jgi:hypothetical protein
MQHKMAILKNLRIDEVSCVVKGANPGAKVMIRKSDDWARDAPLLFNDIMLRKADEIQPPNSATDADKAPLSASLDEIVAEMIAATGGRLHPHRARRWLLHTPQGQELLRQHTTKKETIMPQVDIMKLVTVVEDGLMAQARLTKRDGETEAKAFSRYYENNIDFRRQWATVTDAKLLDLNLNMRKGMPTLTPTSVVVGNTNFADDSAEAVRLLQEMAAKNGQSFDAVLSNPANAKLAARTYTSAHRSSPSYSSEEQ